MDDRQNVRSSKERRRGEGARLFSTKDIIRLENKAPLAMALTQEQIQSGQRQDSTNAPQACC